MNRLCVAGVTVMLIVFCCVGSFAQNGNVPVTNIKPYQIAISYNQTTNLIFPYAIKSVDLGNGAVLAQKAKGVENILQLKAGKENFTPTNVSVVTADGRFYSFVLSYAEQPSPLNINFSGDDPMQLSGELSNARQLEQEACQVLGQSCFMYLQKSEQALRLQLHGIFLSDNNLWLKLQIGNDSQIDFQPAYMRFFLRDKKRTKRIALNEKELLPVYMPELKQTKGLGCSAWTIGFKPFTVPKNQRLIIQVGDESGGRTVLMRIKSKVFLKAHKLPS